MTKAAFNNKGAFYDNQLKSNFRKKTVMCYILNRAVCRAKLENFGKQIRNTCKVLK
jgi:hypothetical protein